MNIFFFFKVKISNFKIKYVTNPILNHNYINSHQYPTAFTLVNNFLTVSIQILNIKLKSFKNQANKMFRS